MNTKEAFETYLEYQQANLKPQTVKDQTSLLKDLKNNFRDREIGEITSAYGFAFLAFETKGLKQGTKHQKIMTKPG